MHLDKALSSGNDRRKICGTIHPPIGISQKSQIDLNDFLFGYSQSTDVNAPTRMLTMKKWARFVKKGEPRDGLGVTIKVRVKVAPTGRKFKLSQSGIPGFHLARIGERGMVNPVRGGN